MNSFTGAGPRTTRQAPRVGDYRRGRQLRTTPAGTWFSAVGPAEEPAGLLLVFPGVDQRVLVPTLQRLIELDLPGVLPSKAELATQAGRQWLISTAPPAPTLAEVCDAGPHRTPVNAAALLTDVAATLREVHRAGLVHGLVTAKAVLLGPDGTALLTDWATRTAAGAADDLSGWAELARMLGERWCADDPGAAAVLAEAADAATTTGADTAEGWDAAIGRLGTLSASADRAGLAQAASSSDAGAPNATAPAAAVRARSHPTPRPATPRPSTPRLGTAQPAALPPAALPPAAPRPAAPRGDSAPDATAPEATAPEATAPRRSGPPQLGRRSLVLAVLTAAVLLSACAALLIPLVHRHGPLEVDSVVLQTRQVGPTCTLVGVLTTNGGEGTVAYRWTGDIAAEPVMSVATPGGGGSIELGRQWVPADSRLGDPVITLQVLEPQPQRASAQPAVHCH